MRTTRRATGEVAERKWRELAVGSNSERDLFRNQESSLCLICRGGWRMTNRERERERER